MRPFSLQEQKKKLDEFDPFLLVATIGLVLFGVVMVYSASSALAAKKYADSCYFLKRQLAYAGVGSVLMWLTMRMDYQKLKKWAVPALFICLALLIAVLIPGLGSTAGGASRWIRLGFFSIQPSELVKVALVVYLAYSLDKKQEQIQHFSTGVLPYVFVLVPILFLLIHQPDLGSAITVAAIACLMLLVAGLSPGYLASAGVLALPFLYVAVFRVEYRRRRILAFLDPWNDPRDTGFQIIQSWYAFAKGGLWGEGLGQGKQKLFYLPEAHTDFILSVIGEELGFLAVGAVTLVFALLLLRAVRMAIQLDDHFAKFLAFGFAALLALESSVNIAVATGLAPTKGLALPFLSYGGSSLVASMFAMGVLLNLSTQIRPAQRGFW